MKRFNQLVCCALLLILSSVLLTACGVLDVRGKTFEYGNVTIDWGMADDEDKQAIYEEYLVSNENELLSVLKTRNGRNQRMTTFGTDGTYSTVNTDNEVLDSGYYKQDDDVVTLSETEDGFDNAGNYTLKVNDKGYKVSDTINSDLSIYAVYQYIVKNS